MTTAYLNGQFLPLEEARISPLDRGFLYGDGVYEVVRTFGGRPFRLPAHQQRLERSLREMRIAADPGILARVVPELIARDKLTTGDALVYLQITRGAPPKRQHAFPPAGTPPTVFLFAWSFEAPRQWYDPGVALVTLSDDRWARCDIKATALLANVMAHQRALEAGANEGLLIRDGAVTEGTLSSVWAVIGGEVRTAPLSNLILPSIKRQVALDCCAAAGIKVRLEPILAHELRTADELFLTSTMHDVAPVHTLDGRPLPDSHPVTDRIGALYRAAVAKECGL